MKRMVDLAMHYVDDMEAREPGFSTAGATHDGMGIGPVLWGLVGAAVVLLVAVLLLV